MSSEYVLGNLRELNSLVADVYVEVSSINYAVADGKSAPKESIDNARKVLAKLNWKIIETAAMLPREQRAVLHTFQTDVSNVSNSLDQNLDLAGCRNLLNSVDAMGLSGALSIQTIGRHVDLTSPPKSDAAA
ncbi:hypothetical protein [Brevundimonas sp. G8]|uniref:hypothetical protein n=1 Tax=Brevundimonas sp. G8 TaxID=1350776 RepID=UPI00135B71A7|nr:hypothetical protein [Brevundimonas sp. G8]